MCDMGESHEMSAQKVARVLLLGNGINRVVARNQKHSWDSVLLNLEKLYLKMGNQLDSSVEGDSISYCLRLQRVLNCIEKDKQAEVFGEWLEQVREIRPNYVHHLLATLVENGDIHSILTTNYDFAFEKALKSAFKAEADCTLVPVEKQKTEITIHHIHGAATGGTIAGTDHVTMTLKSYAAQAASLNWQTDNGWLKIFCENEVHICGLAFYPEEIVLWEALKQRLEYIRSREPFAELGNRLYVYLFYTDSDKSYQYQLAELLKSYAVEPVLIPVGDGDYANAWMTIYGRIALRRHQLRMTEGDSDILGKYKYPQHDTRNKNVRAAYCPSLYYPHCCKFELPLEKDFPVWCFYCEVHRHIYRWMGRTDVIKQEVQKLGSVRMDAQSGAHYFYLDYTTGELYAVKSGEKELCLICKLSCINHPQDFDNLISKK